MGTRGIEQALGEILTVWRVDTGWQVDGIFNFGPNMASFLLMSGSRIWYIVGAYMPPNNTPAVHCAEQALEASPIGMEVILLGDLNSPLPELRGAREEDLAMALVDSGTVNMTDHFTPRRRYTVAVNWAWKTSREVIQVMGRGY